MTLDFINCICITNEDEALVDRVVRGFNHGALFGEFLPEPYDVAKFGDEIVQIPATHPGGVFNNFVTVPEEVLKVWSDSTVSTSRRRAWRMKNWGAEGDVGLYEYSDRDELARLNANEIRLRIRTIGQPPIPMFRHWNTVGFEIFANIDDDEGNYSLVYANGQIAQVPTKKEYEVRSYVHDRDYWLKGPERAVNLDPISPEKQISIIERYERTGRVDAALVELVWRQDAEQGNVASQFNIGTAYLNGDGVKKNMGEAIKWLKRAADQGDEAAQRTLNSIAETLDP